MDSFSEVDMVSFPLKRGCGIFLSLFMNMWGKCGPVQSVLSVESVIEIETVNSRPAMDRRQSAPRKML